MLVDNTPRRCRAQGSRRCWACPHPPLGTGGAVCPVAGGHPRKVSRLVVCSRPRCHRVKETVVFPQYLCRHLPTGLLCAGHLADRGLHTRPLGPGRAGELPPPLGPLLAKSLRPHREPQAHTAAHPCAFLSLAFLCKSSGPSSSRGRALRQPRHSLVFQTRRRRPGGGARSLRCTQLSGTVGSPGPRPRGRSRSRPRCHLCARGPCYTFAASV